MLDDIVLFLCRYNFEHVFCRYAVILSHSLLGQRPRRYELLPIARSDAPRLLTQKLEACGLSGRSIVRGGRRPAGSWAPGRLVADGARIVDVAVQVAKVDDAISAPMLRHEEQGQAKRFKRRANASVRARGWRMRTRAARSWASRP